MNNDEKKEYMCIKVKEIERKNLNKDIKKEEKKIKNTIIGQIRKELDNLYNEEGEEQYDYKRD